MSLSRAIVHVLKTDRIPKILIPTLPVYFWCMLVFWVLLFLSGWLFISCGSYLFGILIVRREVLPSSFGSYYRRFLMPEKNAEGPFPRARESRSILRNLFRRENNGSALSFIGAKPSCSREMPAMKS